jgi:hypothetical protein
MGYFKLNENATYDVAGKPHGEGWVDMTLLPKSTTKDSTYSEPCCTGKYWFPKYVELVNGIYEPASNYIEWANYSNAVTEWHKDRDEKMDALTVTLDGVVYQANETSQMRMTNAATALEAGETVPWVAKDNTVHDLTATHLISLKRAAGKEQAKLWSAGRPVPPSSVNPFN